MRKKRRLRLWPIILILLYLLYFLFANLDLYLPEQRTEIVDSPVESTRNVTEEYPMQETVCVDRNYRYFALGGDVQNLGNTVKPHLELTNLEERWGLFHVNFSYMNKEEFPYQEFGGEMLNQRLASGDISADDAVFHSSNYLVMLGPGDTIIIENRSDNPSPGLGYWAIADIETELINECNQLTVYRNRTVERLFVESKKITRRYTVMTYRKLTDALGIRNIAEWILIMTLLFVIIILLIRILLYFRVERDSS